MGIFPIYDLVMSHSSSQPSPASAASATSSISKKAAAQMFRELLRPILRLAIKAGLRYAELDDALREALFEEARAASDPTKRSNASALSLMTGLHRKETAARLISKAADSTAQDVRVRRQAIVSQVFERWLREARRRPSRNRLPSSDGKESFAALAKKVVTDVHPRAVLDELLRLGLVAEANGQVELLSDSFTPPGAADDRVPLMIENASALLRTCVGNTLAEAKPQLEQAIWGESISLEDAIKLDDLARTQWKRSRRELFDAISETPEAARDETRYRVRIGMYVSYDVMPKPV
jgi:hypothetical protein